MYKLTVIEKKKNIVTNADRADSPTDIRQLCIALHVGMGWHFVWLWPEINGELFD